MLRGRLLLCEKLSYKAINVLDATTKECLIAMDDAANITNNGKMLSVDCDGPIRGFNLARVNPFVQNVRLVSKNNETIRIQGRCNNATSYTFDRPISMEGFVEYLISAENISSNERYEPNSIMISRSKEDRNTWVYREEFLKKKNIHI